MNRFDRTVSKKTNELIEKNMKGEVVYWEDYKKFKVIARALIRQEIRGVTPNDNPKSLYGKTWKIAGKYENINK